MPWPDKASTFLGWLLSEHTMTTTETKAAHRTDRHKGPRYTVNDTILNLERETEETIGVLHALALELLRTRDNRKNRALVARMRGQREMLGHAVWVVRRRYWENMDNPNYEPPPNHGIHEEDPLLDYLKTRKGGYRGRL